MFPPLNFGEAVAARVIRVGRGALAGDGGGRQPAEGVERVVFGAVRSHLARAVAGRVVGVGERLQHRRVLLVLHPRQPAGGVVRVRGDQTARPGDGGALGVGVVAERRGHGCFVEHASGPSHARVQPISLSHSCFPEHY